MRLRTRTFTVAGVALFAAASASASPTMIRLGYARCGACHLAPQGAGLLTDYGKGIDLAQSLKISDYEQSDPDNVRALRYDARLLMSGYQIDGPVGPKPSPPAWLRTYLRGSAAMGAHHRLVGTVVIESPDGDPARFFDTQPAVELIGGYEFRANNAFTLSVTRDRLPRGVELGETRTVLDDGEIERYPAQVRAFISANRFNITAYGYAPGSEAAKNRESRGVGVLGEVLLFGNHVALGVSARHAIDTTLQRQTVGSYARIGFGKWGIVAEHELTTREQWNDHVSTPQRYAGYTQVFYAPVEWLVASVIGEQTSDATTSLRTFAWQPEVQARVTDYITITASARTDMVRGLEGSGRMYLIQVALKTVQ